MTHHLRPTPAMELHQNVATPFERARAMPKSVYTSAEFLEAEQRHVFAKDWICAGRAETLPNPGDYLTLTLAGEPVIVLRDRDGQVKAMSNVCRHRMSTLLEGRGHARSIVCPYHAWTYNLDGTLRGAPAMTLNEGFCKESVALPAVRCEVWQGWIMVSLNADAPSPEETLKGIRALIPNLDMATYTGTGRSWPRISWRAITCPCAMRVPSAGRPSWKKWSAPREPRRSTITGS
jgi:phenylpropionate dioxygenase-like ring-hydroxylating dioxygenase large terminal subunit